MKVKQAVVMVGGMGTRLLPLTVSRPKPVLPVADKPCIWYLLRSMARAGIEEVILLCGYKPEMIEVLGDGSDLGIRIEYSYEDEPRGTAGAIKLVEDRLDDIFVAANGDVFADIDVAKEIEEHISSNAAMTIALTPVPNPCEFGIARVDGTGRILEFKEKPKPEEVFSNLVNAGVYVMGRQLLNDIPAGTFFDLAKNLVPLIMGRGDRIQSYSLDGVWMDVGRPKDLLRANRTVASREHPCPEGASGESYLGEGSAIESTRAVDTVVSKGCHVSGCDLENVLLLPGCKVRNSKFRNVILGYECDIDGCEIQDSVVADKTVMTPGEYLNEGKDV